MLHEAMRLFAEHGTGLYRFCVFTLRHHQDACSPSRHSPAISCWQVSTLRQAILLQPKNIDLYLDFANIAFAHQSFQVGIDVLSDGLVVQPAAAPLYVARGVLYVQVADYDKAEADFAKASALDPTQTLSDAAQGLAAVQENDLDRALATLQSKLASKPVSSERSVVRRLR